MSLELVVDQTNLKDKEDLKPELHIFSFGNNSLTAKIVEKTTQRGIFKLKYAMRELGLDESKVLAVYGPAMAITNTPIEREAGFEDGIKLFIGDCLWPYLGPVCSYGMFYIGSEINFSQLKKKYKNLEKEGVIINSKRFPPGTSHGNHFLEIRKLKNEKNGFQPGYYAFIHTSFEDAGKGVWEYQKTLNLYEIETPLGKVEILDKENAEKFVMKCDEMENLAKKKIALLAEYLFSDPHEIMSSSHKDYFREGNFFGVEAGTFNSVKESLSFISFTKNLPIYLVKGKRNVRREFWQKNHQKVKELGLENLLENVNIMPHGGAETTDNLPYNVEYHLQGNKLCLKGPNGVKIVKDPRELNKRFKTPEEVMPYIKKYDMGEAIAVFCPLYKL